MKILSELELNFFIEILEFDPALDFFRDESAIKRVAYPSADKPQK
jgi:hypothetical protein